MRDEKLWECLLDLMGSSEGMMVALDEFLIAWISIVFIYTIDIISFIIMDFNSIDLNKLTRTRLSILSSNSTNNMCWFIFNFG
jgi:hypothetical protein